MYASRLLGIQIHTGNGTFDPNTQDVNGTPYSQNECAKVTILTVAGGSRGDNGINRDSNTVDPAGAGGKGGEYRVVNDIPIAELTGQNHSISVGGGNGGVTTFSNNGHLHFIQVAGGGTGAPGRSNGVDGATSGAGGGSQSNGSGGAAPGDYFAGFVEYNIGLGGGGSAGARGR